ncbi:hypothetical protein ACCO45_009876 [Purpureocillium lilacinum]|uniref:Uncharacterized protein n=1 Tax=Purpureocillium lilacinum TaxID=33203 RepID=A0ACC4DI93_PURLI
MQFSQVFSIIAFVAATTAAEVIVDDKSPDAKPSLQHERASLMEPTCRDLFEVSQVKEYAGCRVWLCHKPRRPEIQDHEETYYVGLKGDENLNNRTVRAWVARRFASDIRTDWITGEEQTYSEDFKLRWGLQKLTVEYGKGQ